MLSAGDGGAMINDLQMQCGRQHCYVVVAFIGLHDIFILNVIDWGLSSSSSKAFKRRTLLHNVILVGRFTSSKDFSVPDIFRLYCCLGSEANWIC